MASNMLDKVKPTITKHSAEFQKDAYASHPTGELVVFVLAVLQAETSPAAMEEIVSTCFRLFPNSFALRNYFYWPDSALVARHLQHAKEKGLLKGNPTDGYELKGKGKQSAKQTARALNVLLPVPPKVEVVTPEPVAVPKVEEPVIAPPIAEAVKKEEAAPVTNKKSAAKPKKKTEKKATTKKNVTKKVVAAPKKQVEKKPSTSVTAKKTTPTPKPKAKAAVEKKPVAVEKPKVKVKPKPIVPSKPAAKPKEAARKAKTQPAPKVKAKAPKNEAPQQLSMEWSAPAAKQKVEVPAPKPKVKEDALPVKVKQTVKGEVMPAVAASKEEKDKAAKVIKMIERSDAYQLYRRNGRRAQIGEFDFRNMLFATMESSPETLKRNVDLYKRYAGFYFRTDLIAFLEFCEEHFADLLKSKAKLKR